MGVIGTAWKYGSAIWNIADPYMGYRQRVKEGESAGVAAVKSVAEFAAWELMPGPMFALMAKDLATAGMQMGGAYGKQYNAVMSKAHQANFGGGFQMTENAYTMRQRGMQAIQNSRMNTRSVLGSEARYIGGRGMSER